MFSLIAALTILLTRHFVSFLTLPLIGIVIKLFKPETPFVTIAIVISVIILFVSYEASYVQFLVEKEKKLSEEKLKLVNQQMKPHFIFNTLTLIRVFGIPQKYNRLSDRGGLYFG